MIGDIIKQAEKDCQPYFDICNKNAEILTERVLNAFKELHIAQRHFAPSNGYGYDDVARDTLEKLYALVFGAEDALVRPHITSGTHALSLALFGLLKYGDELLSITGKPYDTLCTVIDGENTPGTLKEMGVSFNAVPLKNDSIDIEKTIAAITPKTKVIMIQTRRGYAWRRALSIDEIKYAIDLIKKAAPNIIIFIDNCYGEFTEPMEPTHVGADVIAGSLIKNPGGGLAPIGGYILGKAKYIEDIAQRLTAPGIGRETGSYEASYRPFYQGFFMAPHTVSEALKVSILTARVAELLGFNVSPKYTEKRSDTIQAIEFVCREKLIAFCQGIQYNSPVDSFVTPEPWAMPGYTDQVIMAAGTFVAGASIELSCDAPIRPPYIAYLQGSLSYAHGKIALQKSFERLKDTNLIEFT